VFALQVNRRASVTPHITFLLVIQLLVSRNERQADLAGLLFRSRSFSHSKLGIFYLFLYFPVPRFPVPRFLLPRYQRPLNTQHCIYMSLQK